MNFMKKTTKLLAGAVLGVGMLIGATPSQAAELNWIGGGDTSLFDDLANWDALPTGGTIDTTNLIDTYNVNDAAFNIARTAPLMFVSGGGLNFSAGSLTLTGGTTGLGVLENPDTFGFLNQSGGTIEAQFIAELIVVLSGNAQLNLNGGGNPVNNSTVDFTSETSQLYLFNETVERTEIEHLSKLTSYGSTPLIGTNLLLTSDGGPGTMVTAIEVINDPVFSLTADRDTGNLTFNMNFTNQSHDIIEYDIQSASGSLDRSQWSSIADNGDADSGSSVDADDNWIKFGDPASDTDLSEGTLGELTLTDGVTINLGNSWKKGPFENLVMIAKKTDGTDLSIPISYVGNNDEPFAFGDFNLDGALDELDWPTLRDNMLTDVSEMSGVDAALLGDMTGNGLINENDFFAFKDAFDAANGAGAFAAMVNDVPEPATMTLLGLGGLAMLRRRKAGGKSRAKESRNVKHLLPVLVIAVMTMFGATAAQAETLTWIGGGDTTDFADLANWSGTPTGGVIDTLSLVDEYVVADLTFDISRTERLNFISGGGLTFSAGNLLLTGGTTGIGLLETPDSFGFLNQSGGTIQAQFLAEMIVTLSGTAELIMNGGGNPVNITTVDFTSETSSVHFLTETPAAFRNEHINKFLVKGSQAVEGINLTVVADEGNGSIVTAMFPDLLKLVVNRTTGEGTLVNNTGGAIDMDFYKVSSEAGSLDVSSWDSLEAQDFEGNGAPGTGNGWEEAGGSDALALAEMFLQGSSTFADQDEVSLGNIFSPGDDEDLVLQTRVDINGIIGYLTADVEYIDGGGVILGDVNGDGLVNGFDVDPFVVVLLNGPYQVEADVNEDGSVDGFDVDPFVVLVLSGGSAPQGTEVPEPATLALLGLGSLAALRRRQR